MTVGDDASVLWDLEHLQAARGLTAWMFDQFQARAEGRVLEVGAGIGTFSELLLQQPVTELLLMEPYPACAEVLKEKYGSRPNVQVLQEALPESPTLQGKKESLDFVLCQNVLEHIEDDAAALTAIAGGLKPGGWLGLLVPAHPWLFGNLDRKYEHFRRYTRPALTAVIKQSGLRLDSLYSFNALGIPGWWVQGRRKNAELSAGSLKAYEALLRAWRPIEQRWHPPVGLSLIAHAEKPA